MATKPVGDRPLVRKHKKSGDRELTAADVREAARGAQEALAYLNEHGKLPVSK
ncbi:hypothetical protein [Pseudomonas gingeri]|uniref:Uncharacterized protein n=2 Tax=Pseudomonas gingeri TaxID=117681 RepID=A0A7Y8CMC0_9PSED|nr:hypothetical protein [Pseudomonas gingeri]NWB29501.1 hypothetical protein [Pseudomonas gingeri]NWC36498.1 hypothetical protein [Pseudomonas gingeri]NWD05275.1 hypothetical protein [Pseudomonas gingeri]NWD50846.1 hypothetical protein [Pseudomonas gingeri]NWE31894.1 hypothetical protein [Pseudomonas gingeri]